MLTSDLIVVVPALSKVDLELNLSQLKFFFVRIQFLTEFLIEVYDVLTDFPHFEVIFLHVGDTVADQCLSLKLPAVTSGFDAFLHNQLKGFPLVELGIIFY